MWFMNSKFGKWKYRGRCTCINTTRLICSDIYIDFYACFGLRESQILVYPDPPKKKWNSNKIFWNFKPIAESMIFSKKK